MPVPVLPLIAAGLGVTQSVLGAVGQSNANSANRKLAREQMAFNAAEAQKQREWQEQLIADSRDYYSDVNVRRRLELAGYNPLLYNQQLGNVDTTAGGSAASAPGVPTMQPVNPLAGLSPTQLAMSFAQTENLDANSDKIRSEGVSIDIANEYAGARYLADLMETYARVQNLDIDSDYKDKMLTMLQRRIDLFNDTYEAQKEQPQLANSVLRAQAAKDNADAALTTQREITEKAMRGWNIRLSKAQISLINQQIKESGQRIYLMMAQEEDARAAGNLKDKMWYLTDEQIRHEVEKTAKTVAETMGIEENNKLYPARLKYIESQIYKNYVLGTVGETVGALGAFVAGAKGLKSLRVPKPGLGAGATRFGFPTSTGL